MPSPYGVPTCKAEAVAKFRPLEEPTPLGMRLFDTIWQRRPIRYTLLAAVVVAVLGATYQAQFVTPTLTATRYDIAVSGRDDRALVEANVSEGEIHVVDGRNGLTTFHVVDGSMYVLADEVGADTEATWVHLSRASIDPFPVAMNPSRIADALEIHVKHCRPLTSDSEWWMNVLFGPSAASVDTLCGTAFRNTSDPGTELIVGSSARRPSDLAQTPTGSVVELVGIANQDEVLAALTELLAP